MRTRLHGVGENLHDANGRVGRQHDAGVVLEHQHIEVSNGLDQAEALAARPESELVKARACARVD
jgi:hypothetical protein